MNPIDYACSYQDDSGWNCAAEAGESCTAILISGRRVPLTFMHADRIQAAAAMSCSVGEMPTKKAFDKAVENLI